MGLFDNIAADIAQGAEDQFLKPLLEGFAAPWVKAGKITQAEADESVAGNMVDAKIALLMWLQGKTGPASNVPS